MNLRNSTTNFGLISILFHWVSGVLIIALFALGVWMVGLGYYDKGYYQGPFIHKSVGIILLGLMFLRFIWRLTNPNPVLLSDKPLDRLLAPLAHLCLYWLVFVVCISGYLMVTAADAGISVFNWFDIPSLFLGVDGQADLAGIWHWYLSLALILLTVIHSTAALKHHWIDKNNTLSRMLGKKSNWRKQ
ncbi:MAG: cytochrome b [Pseudomonadales bacterium]|nr:cytochrome b [Pseudomonadales bacterium]